MRKVTVGNKIWSRFSKSCHAFYFILKTLAIFWWFETLILHKYLLWFPKRETLILSISFRYESKNLRTLRVFDRFYNLSKWNQIYSILSKNSIIILIQIQIRGRRMPFLIIHSESSHARWPIKRLIDPYWKFWFFLPLTVRLHGFSEEWNLRNPSRFPIGNNWPLLSRNDVFNNHPNVRVTHVFVVSNALHNILILKRKF